MSLNDTVNADRVQIGFFGKRNAGKSSVMNAVISQQLSLVSDVPGTTADPVKKAMELLPLGAVTVIDTAGYDDEGVLGSKRVQKTKELSDKIDIAVLVIDITKGFSEDDEEFLKNLKNIPYIIAYNKCDLPYNNFELKENEIIVSAEKKINIEQLKEKIGALKPESRKIKIIGEFLEKDDLVILVTPIDESAPKGRLILPQQQTIRDILDANAIAITVKETELEAALKSLSKKPKLVITDSQVFSYVSKIVPKDIFLTSFSILFARYKGDLDLLLNGAKALENLKDNDTVLISEGCTHHRQCGDIGTVKLPDMIKKYTKKNLNFDFTSGGEFPFDLKKYSLIVHCGGCMLGNSEMKNRIAKANDIKIPVTNYGIIMAYINGISERTTELFKRF